MANYNVDIAVAVKNLTSLDKLKRELETIQKITKTLTREEKLQARQKAELIKREIGFEEERINKIRRRARLE